MQYVEQYLVQHPEFSLDIDKSVGHQSLKSDFVAREPFALAIVPQAKLTDRHVLLTFGH